MSEISATIDWLSFTAKNLDDGALFDPPPYLDFNGVTPTQAHFGYRTAIAFSEGVTVMYDGSTKTMGAHYQYPGRALNVLRMIGIPDVQIVAWHAAQGHTCTRCDLAVDVRNSEVFETELSLAVARNQRHGTARSVTEVRSLTGPGRTVYVGSRASEVFTRIYNKSAEQRVPGLWSRCEVELKGKRAQSAAMAINAEGEGAVPALARHLLDQRVGFEFPAWREMLVGELRPLAKSEEPERRTRRWLLETCVKSLVRYTLEHPQEEFLTVFEAAVKDMMGGAPDKPPVG